MSYETKETEEIKGNIILNILQNVDLINDANIGSGLDLFVTSLAQEVGELYDDLDVVYEGTRISTAGGEDLEELGLLVGVTRNTGTKATGTITVERNDPASSNFTISSGAILGTQPNTGETQYQFVTTENIIFKSSIEDENTTFIDGITKYKFNQRFVDSITAIDDGTTTFTKDTDYSLTKDFDGIIINPSNVVLINDCETPGDWTEGDEADAPTQNSSEFIEGSNALNLLKSGSSTTAMSYTHTFSSTFDMTTNSLLLSVYIKDSTELNKINNIKITVSDDASFTENFNITFTTSLETGWNRLILDRNDSEVTTTQNPDYTQMKYVKIEITTEASSDTFSAGELLMDFWFASTYENYEGDIYEWDTSQTVPSDGATLNIDYVPLSYEIDIEAEEVGDEYNIGKGQLTFKISALTNIDRIYNYTSTTGGIDKEVDVDYRERIKNASSLANVATSPAIKENVESLEFVQTVTVNDTPLTSQTNESHVYNDTTKTFVLDNKVVIDDSNLVIFDTFNSLDGAINDSVSTITLHDASSFPSSGTIQIDDELIDYTGKSSNDLTGATRGVDGTTAASHDDDTKVITKPYEKITDYAVSEANNEIDFDQGGSEPSDGDTVYVDYDYNKLGHFEVFVAGKLGSLNSFEIVEIEELLDDIKSAGIDYNITEPTFVSVDVTATVTKSDSADATAVETDVENAIDEYISSLDIGENVLLSGVIHAAMGVNGVDNISVSDIGGGGSADFSITTSQKASTGAISLTVN